MVSDRALDAAVAAFRAQDLPLGRFSAGDKMRGEVRQMLEAAAATIDILDLREATARAIYDAMAREFDEDQATFDGLDDDERALIFRLADAALAIRLDAFAVLDVGVG